MSRRKRVFTEAEDAFLLKFHKKYCMRQVAKFLRCGQEQICRRARELGISFATPEKIAEQYAKRSAGYRRWLERKKAAKAEWPQPTTTMEQAVGRGRLSTISTHPASSDQTTASV